jgi:hypothetical protein
LEGTPSNKLFTSSAEVHTHVAQRIPFLSNIKHGEFSENILYPLTIHRSSDRARLDSNSQKAAVSSDDFYTVIAPMPKNTKLELANKSKQTKMSGT